MGNVVSLKKERDEILHSIVTAPFSPSKLNTFKKCGEAYRLIYEEKVPGEEFSYLKEGSDAHTVLEAFSRSARNGQKIDIKAMGKKLGLDDFMIRAIERVNFPEGFLSSPEDRVIIEGRLAIDCDLTPVSWEDAWVRGITDLAWMEEGASGPLFVIRDWKTGFKVPAQEEIEKELQGAIYALVLSCCFDDAFEFLVEYYYVRTGAIRRVLFDLDELTSRVYDDICHIEDQIKSGLRKPCVGSHCSTCQVRRACEHYAKAFHDIHILNVVTPESAKKAASTYITLKAMAGDLERELKVWADLNGPVRIKTGDLGFFPSEKVAYDLKGAREILLESGIEEEKIEGEMSLSKSVMKGIIGSGRNNRVIWERLKAVETRTTATRFTTKKA